MGERASRDDVLRARDRDGKLVADDQFEADSSRKISR